MAKPRIPSPQPASAARRLKYLSQLEKDFGKPDPSRTLSPELDDPAAKGRFLREMEEQDRDLLNAVGKGGFTSTGLKDTLPQNLEPEMPPLYHGSNMLVFEEYLKPDDFRKSVKRGDVLPGEYLDPRHADYEGHLGPAIVYGSNNPNRGVFFSNSWEPTIYKLDVDPAVKPSDFLPNVAAPFQPNPETFRALIRELRELKVKGSLPEVVRPSSIAVQMQRRLFNDYRRQYGLPKPYNYSRSQAYDQGKTYPYPALQFLANEKLYDIFRKLGIAGLSETYGATPDFGTVRQGDGGVMYYNYRKGTKPARIQHLPAREDHFAFYRPELIKSLTHTGYSLGAATVVADAIISQQQQQSALSGLTEE